jgi:DNA repair exonuclease SbcCD ATPase subunit
MSETNAINPNFLARQSRQQAIRQIEENYKNSLNAAVRAKENATSDATAAKAEAIKQAQAALELARKRLSEAHDRIETRLRKQELDQARRMQEQMLIKAEDTRVKALKQAGELGKRLTIEAVETRRRAIQQAYDDEKKLKLEAVQALKSEKEATRARIEDERKARQKAIQEEAEVKKRAEKAAAAERSARQALEKSKGKTKEHKPEKPEKTAKVATSQATGPAVKGEMVASPLPMKPAARTEVQKEVAPAPGTTVEKAPEAPKPSETVPVMGRIGIVKLNIVYKESDSVRMVELENGLRHVPGIRLVMVGGNTKEGTQIIISSEKSVTLSDTLRQLPMVEEVTDRQKDILIKLKPAVILENKI